MKKMLIPIILVVAFVFVAVVSYFLGIQSQKNAAVENSNDKQLAVDSSEIFKKKIECSELAESFFLSLQAKSDEYNSFSVQREELNVGEEVCYSETLNTCVVSYSTLLFDTDTDRRIMTTVTAEDLLTGESIFSEVLFEDEVSIEDLRESAKKRDEAVKCSS
jgi:hypothetical protein